MSSTWRPFAKTKHAEQLLQSLRNTKTAKTKINNSHFTKCFLFTRLFWLAKYRLRAFALNKWLNRNVFAIDCFLVHNQNYRSRSLIVLSFRLCMNYHVMRLSSVINAKRITNSRFVRKFKCWRAKQYKSVWLFTSNRHINKHFKVFDQHRCICALEFSFVSIINSFIKHHVENG